MLCVGIGSIHCVSVARPNPHLHIVMPYFLSFYSEICLNILIVLASFMESGRVYQKAGAL